MQHFRKHVSFLTILNCNVRAKMGLLNDSSQKKQLKIMPSVYSANLVFPGLVL